MSKSLLCKNFYYPKAIHGSFHTVAGENIVTNNNLVKNNLSITPYAKTTW